MVAAKRKVSASDFTFGPKQKSLFCFFSKPSANPYAATTCGHPSSQLLGDSSPAGSDECGKDSDSSSMQDVDRLQCSELLPGLLTHAGTQSVSVKGSFFSDNAVTRENEDFLAASLTGRTSFDGVDGINDFGDYAFGNACQNNGSRTLRAVKIYKRTRSQLADVRGPCLATHAVYKSIGSQNEAGRPFYSISHETSEPMKHIHEPISLEMDAPCQSLPLGNAIKTYSGRNTSEKDSVLPEKVLPDNENISIHPTLSVSLGLDTQETKKEMNETMRDLELVHLDSPTNSCIHNEMHGVMNEDLSTGIERSKTVYTEHGKFKVPRHLVSMDMNDQPSQSAWGSVTQETLVKLKRGSGHRVSAPEVFSEPPLTAYEREREENILRNQHFMQKLGLTSSVLTVSRESALQPRMNKSRGKVTEKVKPQLLPVRRSRRLIQESIGRTQYKDEETVDQTTNDAPIEEDPVFYDDSSVLKYTCGEEVVNISSRYSEDFAKFGEANIIGFHPSDGGLQDKHLTRIYSMSVCFVSQCRRTLLAAGGHQGQIAVFGFASPLGSEEETASESDCSSNPVYREPLLSWKGSTGWISGVKFLSVKDRENVNLLLSSANDGKLILWDINKQQKLQQTSKSLERLPPMKVTEASNIHTNGIFSMQECSGHVVTASKDGTLGCSKITNQDIIMERSVSGHHMGAIRGVNFRQGILIYFLVKLNGVSRRLIDMFCNL
ncbi:hypothetical protein KP509_07G094500 [Ceratopteris richardii]|uniref:Uncharacterized protein n=1 Tax=Ceratopteris richardii TaxID=49495 RepID=A0A8T2UDB6_CERRI|nr:hypothetical protein KP509_07G094500 [Ceratopteris richardii]